MKNQVWNLQMYGNVQIYKNMKYEISNMKYENITWNIKMKYANICKYMQIKL